MFTSFAPRAAGNRSSIVCFSCVRRTMCTCSAFGKRHGNLNRRLEERKNQFRMSRQKDKIIVIGGKGTAVNIAEQIDHADRELDAPVEFLGFAIDDDSLGKEINGYPVLCKTREVKEKYPQQDVKFLFALYKPEKMMERVALLNSYEIPPGRFALFVHPQAYVSKSAKLESGVVVLAHATVHVNVVIGSCSIINCNSVLEHDTVLGPYNFVSACVCIGSHVRMEEGVFVGLNSTLREELRIGKFSFIGMGANVVKDVRRETTVYGNPARDRV